MQLTFSGKILEKIPNVKFDENPSSGRRFFPCGRTEAQKFGRTDGKK
jgi:hypothetical protein